MKLQTKESGLQPCCIIFFTEPRFKSTALLQDFYASGFYFHSLISLPHYCERQCLITTEVLERYQIALQTAGAGTTTASATAPLRAPLSPLAPGSQQCRTGSGPGLHLCSSFQPLLLLPGAQQSTCGLMCSIADFRMVLHKEKEDHHHRMEQLNVMELSPANSSLHESSHCPALHQLGAEEQ